MSGRISKSLDNSEVFYSHPLRGEQDIKRQCRISLLKISTDSPCSKTGQVNLSSEWHPLFSGLVSMRNQSWSSKHTCRQHLANIFHQSGQRPCVRILRVSVSVLGSPYSPFRYSGREADEGFSVGDHQSYPRKFIWSRGGEIHGPL